jgi:hypothetical protein
MDKIVFSFIAHHGYYEAHALVLARSIRTFGGEMANSPIWIMIPQNEDNIASHLKAELLSLNTHIIPFPIDEIGLRFPFAAKAYASAAAEEHAQDRTEILVSIDSNVLVFNAPTPMLLDPKINLGYRPVDHTLIGSLYDNPLDEYWQLVYEHCRVPEEHLFPMSPSADNNIIRPYFNAGLLVVRPERGTLRRWRTDFDTLYRQPFFKDFYEKHNLYRIFIHQAILTGSILSHLGTIELQELPHTVNYSLFLHNDYPPETCVAHMEDLVSARYEDLNGKWRLSIDCQPALDNWLEEQMIFLQQELEK